MASDILHAVFSVTHAITDEDSFTVWNTDLFVDTNIKHMTSKIPTRASMARTWSPTWTSVCTAGRDKWSYDDARTVSLRIWDSMLGLYAPYTEMLNDVYTQSLFTKLLKPLHWNSNKRPLYCCTCCKATMPKIFCFRNKEHQRNTK